MDGQMDGGQTDGRVDGRQRFYEEVWDFLTALLPELCFMPQAARRGDSQRLSRRVVHLALGCSPSDQRARGKVSVSSWGRLPGAQLKCPLGAAL